MSTAELNLYTFSTATREMPEQREKQKKKLAEFQPRPCSTPPYLRHDLLPLRAIKVPLLGLTGLAYLRHGERLRVVPFHLFERPNTRRSEGNHTEYDAV